MQFFSLERYRNRYGHNDDIQQNPMYNGMGMGQQDIRYMNGRSDMYIEEAEDYDDEYSDDDDYDLESPVSDLDIDISEIDFSKVYAYHTFIANVEGQICVQKDDVLDLLDDTHDYWWLVRCISTNEIGYLPADNIELPYERVARANRFKNVQVAAVMPQDTLHRYKERTKKIKFSTSPPTIHMVENREDYEDYDEYGSDEGPFYDDEEEEDMDEPNPNMNMNQMNNNMYNNGMDPNINMMNNGLNLNNPNGPLGRNNIILSTEPFNHSLSLYDHEEKKYLKKGGFFSKLLKKNKKKNKSKRISDSIPHYYNNQGYNNMAMNIGMNNYNSLNMNNMNSLNRMNGGMNDMNNMNSLNRMNGGINDMNNMNSLNRMNGGINDMNNMNSLNRMNGGINNMNSLNRMNGGMNDMNNMNSLNRMNGGMNNMNNINRINGMNQNEINNMNYNPMENEYNNKMQSISSLQSFPPRNEQPMFQQNYPSPALDGYNNTPELSKGSPYEDNINHYGSPQMNLSPSKNSGSPNTYNKLPNENSNMYTMNLNKPNTMEYPEIEINEEEKENIRKLSNENSEDEDHLEKDDTNEKPENVHNHRKSHHSERDRERDRDRHRERERESEREKDRRKDMKSRTTSLRSSSKPSISEKEKDRRKSEKPSGSKTTPVLSEKHISVLNPSSSSSINIIKIFTGNFDVEQTPYKSVSVNSNTTVKEMIKSALYRFKLPRDTYHDYYMSIIHFDSKEKTLNPNDEVFKILEHIKNKKLPGATKRLSQSVSILSEEDKSNSTLDSHRLSRNILNDRNIKFILNKKNENSSHCRLVRVFIDQRDEFGKKMFKTVGVTSKETAENIIEYALKKFSVLHGKSIDDFVLHAYTRKKLIPIRNSYIIFYLIKQEIEKGSRKVDFVMKEKTERDRERERRKSMRKSKLKAENESKDKKDRERIKSTISQYATYDDKFDPNETVMIPKLPKPIKSLDKSYSEYSQMSIEVPDEEREKNNKELTNLLNSLKSKGDDSILEGKPTPPLSGTRGRSHSNSSVTMKLNKMESPSLNSPSMKFSSVDRVNGRGRSNSDTKPITVPSALGKLNPRNSSSSYKSYSPNLDDKNSKINKNLAKQRLMPIVKPSHMRERKGSEASILSASSKQSNNDKTPSKEEKSNLDALLSKSDQVLKSIEDDTMNDISEEISDEEVIIQDPPQMPSRMQQRRGSTASTSSHVNFDEMLSTLDEMSVMLPENNKDSGKEKLDSIKEINESSNKKEKENEKKDDEEKKDEIKNDNKEKEEQENNGISIKGMFTNLLKNNPLSKSENEVNNDSKDGNDVNNETGDKATESDSNAGGSIFDKLKFATRTTSNETGKNSSDNGSSGSIFDKLKIPTRTSSNNTKPIFSPNLKYFKKSGGSNSSTPTLSESEKPSPLSKPEQKNENVTSKEKEKEVVSEVPVENTEKVKENLLDALKDPKAKDTSSKEEEEETKKEEVEKKDEDQNDEDKKVDQNGDVSKDLDKPKKYKSILKAPKEYPMPEELRKLEDLRLEEAKRSSSIRHSRRLAERERRKSRSRERLRENERKEKEGEPKDENEDIEEDEEAHRRRVRSMVSSRSHRSSRSASRRRHASSRPSERRPSRDRGTERKEGEEEGSLDENEERRRRHASRRVSERHASRRSHHVSRRLPPETEEERARRHASRRLPPETEEERARRHASRRLPPETEEERARRHASRRLPPETEEERERRRSRRHVSRRIDAEEERRRRERSDKEKGEDKKDDESKEPNQSMTADKAHERRSRVGERHHEHHEHRHRHHSTSTSRSRINISGDIIIDDDAQTQTSEKIEPTEVKMIDVANISDLPDDQPHSASIMDSEDIIIPDRALHMEERLYTRGKGLHSEASNTSFSSVGSVSSIGSESSVGSHQSADSTGSHHHHHHRRSRSHSRSHSHSKDRSSSRDRNTSMISSSSEQKRRESHHRSTHHRSVRPDGERKTPGSPLVNEKDRRSRHEHSRRSVRSRRENTGDVSSSRIKLEKTDGSKPEVSSSLKKSHRISSMARPPRIDTRSSLRISIPNATRRSIRKSSASSDISINALMDEMRQMMTGTPNRDTMSPFAKELNKLEMLQRNNEDGYSTPGSVDHDIGRQGSETYRDHIMHKMDRAKRNSKASIGNNSVSSFNSMDLWKKAEERQFRFSQASSNSNENIGKNIEYLKKELEELATDKEKRRSRLSMGSTGRSSQISTARSSKFDDTYLKSLLDKLSDTKASKRYSQRNSRIMNDLARRSMNFDERKEEKENENVKEREEKEPEEPETPKIQDASDEENNQLLASLQECEIKFESLNKDLNSLLFNSIKLFDNLILS